MERSPKENDCLSRGGRGAGPSEGDSTLPPKMWGRSSEGQEKGIFSSGPSRSTEGT